MTIHSKTTPRHQRPTQLTKFLFGAPYYPEHWTPKDRAQDPERMAAAGVNVVRMGEFAWDLMEPEPGIFDFSLFDATIERLGKKGISTILCTPTATPPRWLTIKHPEWMRIDAQDKHMIHGSRQHCCTSNAEFRRESQRITNVMSEHFAKNPHIIGWQTDNELHCHISECYCASCQSQFQEWARAKYIDLTALNKAWGTSFWAQTYTDFSHIPLPYLDRPTHPNPHQMLDYYRFISDGVIRFQQEQLDILRKVNSRWWITHNGLYGHIDNWNFAENLDFMGVDIYPGFLPEKDFDRSMFAALQSERCRSVSGNFIVPELQGGAGGQRPYLHETPRPGQMRLWFYQTIAHGADAVLHFRWRSCRHGAEMYWNGILDHDNIPRRRYEEFAQEGNEIKRIGPALLGTTEDVRAAVLWENDQNEAHGPLHLSLPGPWGQDTKAYRQLWLRHLPAGIVDASDSLEGLNLLIIPSFYVIDEQLAEKLTAFVQNGGVLVATARTATRNRFNQVLSETPPGLLRSLFGMGVIEFGKLETPTISMELLSRKNIPVQEYEILEPTTAEVLATWSESVDGGPHAAARQPAITINRAGKGLALYIGTFLTPENSHELFNLILSHAKIEPLAQAVQGVEITHRRSADTSLFFVLNHTTSTQSISGLPQGNELITERTCNGTLTLNPYEVAILQASAQ